MKLEKVLVLEGGYNEEHEISLSTAKEVKKSLNDLKIEFDSLIVNPKTFKKDIMNFDNKYICFNALHGTFGEDGSIQNILDDLNFKYTHSSSKSSNIGFNKNLSKKEIEDTPIIYPEYLNLNISDLNEEKLKELFNNMGAFIIKPNSSGSSFGISIFSSLKDINLFLDNKKDNIRKYQNHNNILIEKYLKGRELTVTVMEKNAESFPVEVTEIISFNDNFFDYNSKYTLGASKHILPADLKKNLYDKCKRFSKLAHDKIGCRGISRSDFILVDEDIYFLEINTQPGLTPVSLVPEQLKKINISFNELILNILKCAL